MKTLRRILLGATAALIATAALAQGTVPATPVVPLGYCQLTSIDASTLVSTCSGGIPAGANVALLTPEAQAIRYRDDGTAPTAAVGQPMAVAASLLYTGTLSKLRVISQTSGAKLNVTFYKSP